MADTPMTFRDKLCNIYTWCRFLTLMLNVLFLMHTFGGLYGAGARIADAQKDKLASIPAEAIARIFIYVSMLFCLVIDLIVITTTKLHVANWYWRPGIFFLAFTCCDELITLIGLLLDTDELQQQCLQHIRRLTPAISMLTTALCDLDVRVNHMYSMLVLLRDMLACALYAGVGHFHLNHLVTMLRHEALNDPVSTHHPLEFMRTYNHRQSLAVSEAPTLIEHRR